MIDALPGTRWVVRSINPMPPYGQPEYSVSGRIVLFQLSWCPLHAERFATYADASAHASHLAWIYRQPFQVVARVADVRRPASIEKLSVAA